MTATESDRILAAGVPIQLAGGEARLRFDWLAYHRLEKRYGSIAAAAEKLQTLWAVAMSADAPLASPVLDDLVEFLGAGTRKTADKVLEELPVDVDMGVAIGAYALACIAAWHEAFPPLRAEGNEGGEATTSPSPSPGPTPTGSSPESADAAMASSGA